MQYPLSTGYSPAIRRLYTSVATDGNLGGAAELQKSNNSRSWRKLDAVPAEAGEVQVTPRERGNKFYRLKKN
jgi:hypothetical protein